MRVLGRAGTLGIYLRPTQTSSVRVGSLHRDPEGSINFVVDQSYIDLGPTRPILSLAWKGVTEDGGGGSKARLLHRGDKITQGAILPAFFENLLPEGALLGLVQKEFGAGAFDSHDVLARLGEDLPGAVVAVREAGDPLPDVARAQVRQDKTEKIRFSLAGVQLKFSMKQNDKGSITIPMAGSAGDIILKTPSEKHRMMPEAEFTALSLARAVRVRAAEAKLVANSEVEGIDRSFLVGGTHCLAVTRFDRADGMRRIHTEDFAQVIGSIHDQKYASANQSTLARLTGRFASDRRGEILQAVRRIVVDLMLGNSDSHLKNWSFIFPGGISAALSPAYDIVPMFYYGDDSMALEFGGSRDPAFVGLRRFSRLAGLADLDADIVLREVTDTVEAALDVWPGMLPNLPMPPDFAVKLTGRWKLLSLVKEVRSATSG